MVLVEDQEQRRRDEEQRRSKIEQERAERERRRKIEQARWKHLVDLAESARQANMVREFLDTLEQRALSAAGQPDSTLSTKVSTGNLRRGGRRLHGVLGRSGLGRSGV